MIAIVLVVAALAILFFVLWWFFIRGNKTTSEAAKKSGVTPSTVAPGCMLQGLDICKNKVNLLSDAGTTKQGKEFMLHNDCSQSPVIAPPGILNAGDEWGQAVEFTYESATKTYEIIMRACDRSYRLCAFQNGGSQKAMWLNTSEPTTGPATTTAGDWSTGARSCSWTVVPSGKGVLIRVPSTAATSSLRGQYLSFDANAYWLDKETKLPYYAIGILAASPSNATWVLKDPAPK